MGFVSGDQVTIMPPYDQDTGPAYIWRYQHHGVVRESGETRCRVELGGTGRPLPRSYWVPAARLTKGWVQV